jgi:hypothetical protein
MLEVLCVSEMEGGSGASALNCLSGSPSGKVLGGGGHPPALMYLTLV